MADLAQFDLGSAQRIARVVRAVEQEPRRARPLGFLPILEQRRGGGVRLCKTVAVWEHNTVATLQVWEDGFPTAETQSTGQTVDAVNKMYRVAAGAWVVVARCVNGIWYLVEAGDNEPVPPEGPGGDACVQPSIGGRDLTDITGYDSAKTQALSHAQGCLKWIDIEDCPAETPA